MVFVYQRQHLIQSEYQQDVQRKVLFLVIFSILFASLSLLAFGYNSTVYRPLVDPRFELVRPQKN
jgi:hypothetical protein